MCPIRSQYSLDRLEMVLWESVPRGSSARAWKLSSRHFSRSDWLPPGLRGCEERGEVDVFAGLLTTVFVDTRLSKTKHPRKRFQNFRQSCMLSTDRIEIHQSQPVNVPGLFHLNRIATEEIMHCYFSIFLKSVDWKKLNKSSKNDKCCAEIFMQIYYATEVNSLSVYLPSQYGYPNERNFTVNRLHERKQLLE